MPLFEYACDDCGKKFEELTSSGDQEVACPSCGSPKTHKLLSVFAASVPTSSGAPACARPGCGSGFS